MVGVDTYISHLSLEYENNSHFAKKTVIVIELHGLFHLSLKYENSSDFAKKNIYIYIVFFLL